MLNNLENIRNSEWYQQMIEDCQSIIVERTFNSKSEEILGKWELGERILEEEKKGITKSLQRVAVDLNKGERDLWYCIEFKRTYPKFKEELGNWGKNISWRRVIEELTTPPEKKLLPLPKGKYNVIYADPPWEYSNSGISGAAANHYPTMSTEKIRGLKIPSSENSVLFLWTTNPLLEDALKVINSWGFGYKTNIVWIKEKAGQGFYVKGQHELLLICVKGNKIPDNSIYVRSVVELPRQEHSRKPDKFYEIIETLYPKGKYLELFARNKRRNWTSWGNDKNVL